MHTTQFDHHLFRENYRFKFLSVFRDDIVFSTSTCHPSTKSSSTRNWTMCSANSNAPPKSSLYWNSIWNTLKMERVDTFKRTKTIRLWRGLNMWVMKMIRPMWKRSCSKSLLSTSAKEKERALNGNYKLTKVTVFASLLRDRSMGRKDCVSPELFWKQNKVNCPNFERKLRKTYDDNPCLFRALDLHLH